MLDKELEYYQNNRTKLLDLYPQKTIVIKNDVVIGIYDSHEKAYLEARKEHEVGSFLIKTLSD